MNSLPCTSCAESRPYDLTLILFPLRDVKDVAPWVVRDRWGLQATEPKLVLLWRALLSREMVVPAELRLPCTARRAIVTVDEQTRYLDIQSIDEPFPSCMARAIKGGRVNAMAGFKKELSQNLKALETLERAGAFEGSRRDVAKAYEALERAGLIDAKPPADVIEELQAVIERGEHVTKGPERAIEDLFRSRRPFR